jgi:hypothetical protein
MDCRERVGANHRHTLSVQEKSVYNSLRIDRLITAAKSKGIVLVKAVGGGSVRSGAEVCCVVLVKEQGTKCSDRRGRKKVLCGENDLRLRLKESCWCQGDDGWLCV